MKARVEPQGLHYYCRRSGTHILFDEVKTKPSAYSLAPRTVSIAITNECDFRCSYCYVNLQDRYLSKSEVLEFCKELDRFGTFDVALGGGEPTLHPELVEICQSIWKETELGISITTHGHNLEPGMIADLEGAVSFVRVSIDGGEPVYSKLRKMPLEPLLKNLKHLHGKIPFGINAVINKLSVQHLNELRDILLETGGTELLLLPMWNKGQFVLSGSEWSLLEDWIHENYQQVPIRVSSESRDFLNLPFLFEDEAWDNDYAFIGIDKKLHRNSFTSNGLEIGNYDSFEQLLHDWRASLQTSEAKPAV